jgi:hypothetical protein
VVLADFEINVELEPPRSVRVVVYDSHKGLRIAATRYDNLGTRKSRRRRGKFSETLGICHRFEWQNDAGETRPLCAIVRLAKPDLGVGIVSHELAHAAVWIRELNGDLDPLTTHNDEPFAWLLGELVRQAINAMNERGVFDEGGE